MGGLGVNGEEEQDKVEVAHEDEGWRVDQRKCEMKLRMGTRRIKDGDGEDDEDDNRILESAALDSDRDHEVEVDDHDQQVDV